MNGSKGSSASDTPETPDRGDTVLSLKTVQRMLPLVRRIVEDVLQKQQAVNKLFTEQDLLDDSHRNLAWPQRQRRYQIKDDLTKAEKDLGGTLDELRALGLKLLDAKRGQVGFPTMVNNRRAFFSWQPGDDRLHHWRFVGEEADHEIPAAWLKEISMSVK